MSHSNSSMHEIHDQLDRIEKMLSALTNKQQTDINNLTKLMTDAVAQITDHTAMARTNAPKAPKAPKSTKAAVDRSLPFNDDDVAAEDTQSQSGKAPATAKPPRGKMSACDAAIDAYIRRLASPLVTVASFTHWRGDKHKGIRSSPAIQAMLLEHANSLNGDIRSAAVIAASS